MSTESTSTSTKGGSVPHGMPEICPACGFPELPSIEPETLQMLTGCEAVAGWVLQDGRLPVHAQGRIYLMPQEAWSRYRKLCASAEVTAAAMRG